MPAFAVTALLSGRIIAAGLACGLNLYATVALIGLASRFGWIELPPGLLGLGQWILIGAAGALFVIEFVAAAIPVVDAFWEAAHTVIRPMAAGALAFTALEGTPPSLRIAAGVLAATAALAAHSAKVGLRLIITRRRSRRLLISAGEDLAAVILAVAALAYPRFALAAVAAVTLFLAAVGPRFWRASAFAVRATLAVLRGFFGSRRWLDTGELPLAIRQRIPAPELGLPDPRAARAALDSTASGPWRNGWLVLDGRSASFFYRRAFRTLEVRLHRPDDPAISHGPLADVIAWIDADQPFTLHVLKDGPSAEIAAGALQLTVR
ncbi:MAG TPA: DUF4126 domain-containing protein [Longimicrobiales bacterium]|nr:DUF4126 domain-containing protein [Longimicrobiales bacterium]